MAPLLLPVEANATDVAAVARDVAAALSEGQCPSAEDLAAVHEWQASYRAVDDAAGGKLREFFGVLVDSTRLNGLTFDGAWLAAAAAPTPTAASESLRQVSGCFGANVEDAATYKVMVDEVKAGMAAARVSVGGAAERALGQLVANVVTSRDILAGIPVRREARITYTDPQTGQTRQETLPAVGVSSAADESALGVANPAKGGAQVYSRIGESAGIMLAPKQRRGWANFSETLVAVGPFELYTLYGLTNEIEYFFDYDARRVSKGSAWEMGSGHYNVRPIAFWDFKGWKYNRSGYDKFNGYRDGEYLHKIKGDFRYYILTIFGYLELDQDDAWIHLYGHYDGLTSHYEGAEKDYVYCQEAEECP